MGVIFPSRPHSLDSRLRGNDVKGPGGISRFLERKGVGGCLYRYLTVENGLVACQCSDTD